MRNLIERVRALLPPRRRSFHENDRAEVDRAMREGREITTAHMTEKIQHPGNHM